MVELDGEEKGASSPPPSSCSPDLPSKFSSFFTRRDAKGRHDLIDRQGPFSLQKCSVVSFYYPSP